VNRPTPDDVTEIVGVLAELDSLPELLTNGGHEERKRIVGSFLAGVNVDHRKGQATLQWYRLPHLDECAAMLVEAVGIEPTSENPQPQASTSVAGLSYGSLAPRSSIRQEGRGASLIYLALPLRPGSGPATRI
jgi:hypothetical protein